MNKQEYIRYCASFPGALIDQPFADDFDTFVARHAHGRKWFALIMEHEGRAMVNLKSDPAVSYMLRDAFEGVIPAYHMNKWHWNSVYLDSDVPEGVLREMTEASFALTMKK